MHSACSKLLKSCNPCVVKSASKCGRRLFIFLRFPPLGIASRLKNPARTNFSLEEYILNWPNQQHHESSRKTNKKGRPSKAKCSRLAATIICSSDDKLWLTQKASSLAAAREINGSTKNPSSSFDEAETDAVTPEPTKKITPSFKKEKADVDIAEKERLALKAEKNKKKKADRRNKKLEHDLDNSYLNQQRPINTSQSELIASGLGTNSPKNRLINNYLGEDHSNYGSYQQQHASSRRLDEAQSSLTFLSSVSKSPINSLDTELTNAAECSKF
ncbi:hypothetical protein DAPPUDRAFT_110786 [Daphnia pulex]|uniref:Uncharacterized protein n=1 Tax=Daphnia pulex TaxID=6669 RepID=E9H764_DAPPU|nr:hypothetical protein DAPPUDRAFT_110786 [Daphnia pulex]|eukprot:EFX72421.1 hypothetical protein DAPPUDRAFT_110786 [Daphnia pulex]